MDKKQVIVIGAGPAGLAAAWEATQLGQHVTVLEQDARYVGGLARTIDYKGFRFDIGAHRFFTKNSEIAKWWRDRLPNDFQRVNRLTRILYNKHFYRYPLRFTNAFRGLGFATSTLCLLSYLWRQLFRVHPEHSFENWVRNRFGDQLYRIFFKTYTEKVWGIPCNEISANWASQRIKGLSLATTLLNSVGLQSGNLRTLTNEFEYPRLGAGMMWERAAQEIRSNGGKIELGKRVTRIIRDSDRIVSVETTSPLGELENWPADEFIASMPLSECVLHMDLELERDVRLAAEKLSYRDMILIALIVKGRELFPDNWIYVHDPAVKVGRIENYNNWSSAMVPPGDCTGLVLEYFCSNTDTTWQCRDSALLDLAKNELEYLGLAKATEILDGCAVRVEKAYPIYDAGFQTRVDVIRDRLAKFENLQVIGRNGMHKYNNQDHSMWTGILAARNLTGRTSDVWCVNGDAEYLEETRENEPTGRQSPTALSACAEPASVHQI